MKKSMSKGAAPTTEAGLQGYMLGRARLSGFVAHKLESRSARGWPDCCLIYKGQVVFVEVKSPKGGRLSMHQKKMLETLLEHDAVAVVVNSVDEVDRLIESMALEAYR